jgi:micrococcal nuclease
MTKSVFCAAALLIGAGGFWLAADAPPERSEPQQRSAGVAEHGRVVTVYDGDTLRVAVEGGRAATVRLIGVDAPETRHPGRPVERFGHEATAFTASLAAGQRVRLERDPQAADRDRHGRLLRYVFLADGRLLNAEIVAQGFAHAFVSFPFERLEAFRALERQARDAQRGLWGDQAADETASGPPLSPAEAAAHVGQPRTVCGRVASARHLADRRGQPTLLNLDRPYPDHLFTVVIWGRDRARFERPEERLHGRHVCASGTIELYRGLPQIVVDAPDELRETAAPL